MTTGQIVSRTIVERYAGGITVVEGDVLTDQGEVTFCWVEQDGERVSSFTDIDEALAIAEQNQYQDEVSSDFEM